eukprot:gene1555-4643_t
MCDHAAPPRRRAVAAKGAAAGRGEAEEACGVWWPASPKAAIAPASPRRERRHHYMYMFMY